MARRHPRGRHEALDKPRGPDDWGHLGDVRPGGVRVRQDAQGLAHHHTQLVLEGVTVEVVQGHRQVGPIGFMGVGVAWGRRCS
jgi:hypothetical protein